MELKDVADLISKLGEKVEEIAANQSIIEAKITAGDAGVSSALKKTIGDLETKISSISEKISKVGNPDEDPDDLEIDGGTAKQISDLEEKILRADLGRELLSLPQFDKVKPALRKKAVSEILDGKDLDNFVESQGSFAYKTSDKEASSLEMLSANFFKTDFGKVFLKAKSEPGGDDSFDTGDSSDKGGDGKTTFENALETRELVIPE